MKKRLLCCFMVLCISTTLYANNKPLQKQIFDKLLEKHLNMTYEQFYNQSYKKREYLNQLSFDPTKVAYYQEARKALKLTAEEEKIFRQTGMVAVDQMRNYSFGSAFFEIYRSDLPVLITTDSILQALYKSYDNVLIDMEQKLFTPVIESILRESHLQLTKGYNSGLKNSYRDVDLYLSVARNLLAGAGAPKKKQQNYWDTDNWNGQLLVKPHLVNGKQVLNILNKIRSLELQVPRKSLPTKIYGGKRFVDYSQFKPRGHYTKSTALKRYFRCMMWLGRADCGMNIMPISPKTGLVVDSKRELTNAVLLSELVATTGSTKKLQTLDEILNFMIGSSDNFGIFELLKVNQKHEISLKQLVDEKRIKKLQQIIGKSGYGAQMIRSQVIKSSRYDTYKVPPPNIFQMFGQRFIIDSFVLAEVVFDSIIFNNRKQERRMPVGLDVMAALGNNETIPLLKSELKKWNYSANLMASREFVAGFNADFWQQNLYNIWLDSLRTLDEIPEGKFPQAMRTKSWQMKQLQTQLASWAQLRHNTVLYAKQSYTGSISCVYPFGYVEPYPEFYAKIKFFSERAAKLLGNVNYDGYQPQLTNQLKTSQKKQVEFFNNMAGILGKLETMANKELKGIAFSDEEKKFIKQTISRKTIGCGELVYNGWYCDLFYSPYGSGGDAATEWDPTVVDVHTDPNTRKVLEVGVGNISFCMIAIDNDNDRSVYVGPMFSYYEFHQPASKRLTDQQWQQMIWQKKLPKRPSWVGVFQPKGKKR